MPRLAAAAGLVLATICALVVLSPADTLRRLPGEQIVRGPVPPPPPPKDGASPAQASEKPAPPAPFDAALRDYLHTAVDRRADETDLARKEMDWRRRFPSTPIEAKTATKAAPGH